MAWLLIRYDRYYLREMPFLELSKADIVKSKAQTNGEVKTNGVHSIEAEKAEAALNAAV